MRTLTWPSLKKKLLRWHQRLGHLGMRKIQFLMRTGVLASSGEKRRLHTSAAKIREPPKCAACQFGKQTVRSVRPRGSSNPVRDNTTPRGTTTADLTLPGQRIFVDHMVCSTKGCTPQSRGSRSPRNMYSGSCFFVDGFSGWIHVEHQFHLNTHETLDAKRSFEMACRDMGIIPQSYFSDSGSAFTSRAFEEHLQEYRQIIHFAGTSAHHTNGKCERAIRSVMSIARTMMLHAAIHWPDMADASLWPMAVDLGVFLFNHVPDPSTGLSAHDVFSGQRWPLRHLHDLHVFGAPSYLLAKRLGDGQKIPKLEPRSTRCVSVGLSKRHASMIPLILNPTTRTFTTPFNVVFDDWFATVSSDLASLPDLHSTEWTKLFGDSTYQYYGDGETDSDDENDTPLSFSEHRTFQSRESVAAAMESDTPNSGQHTPVTPARHTVAAPSSQPTAANRNSATATSEVHVQRENDEDPSVESVVRPPAPRTPRPAVTPRTPQNFSAPTPPSPLARVSPPAPPSPEPTPPSPPTSPDPVVVKIESPVLNPVAERPKSRLLRELMDFNNTGNVKSEPTHARRTRRQPEYLNVGNPGPEAQVERPTKPRFEVNTLLRAWNPVIYKASKSDPDTLTLDQALSNPDPLEREAWLEACDKEIRELERMGAWEEVPAAEATTKIIPMHWVAKQKRLPDNTPTRKKMRICCRGDLMGDDHGYATSSQVAFWSTIRMMLVLSLTWGWHTCTCDYSNAFIHSTLPEDKPPVFVQVPRGYRSALKERACLRLKKSLYGTTFAPRLWSDTLSKALRDYGLEQCEHDTCLFIKPGMMVCTFVDDLAIAVKDPEEKLRFVKAMEAAGFSLTMDDTLSAFLGIKFEPLPDGSFNMTQPGLIDKIIKATGMEQCNPNATPCTPNKTLGKDPEGEDFAESWSMSSVTGMLLYLSTNTRIDIAFAVSQVCRFTHNPKQSHAQAVKTIVRYLAGTRTQGTIMRPNGTLSVNSYSDSDLAGLHKSEPMEDPNSAKSRMGYIISLGGCPLIWKSQLITSVCLATAEAEYYSLSRCLRALIPIRRTLEELVTRLAINTTLRATISSTAFGDNSAALTLATQQRLTSRTRYYHTSSHHFWQHVGTTEDPLKILIKACSSAMMDADYLTKSMPAPGFVANRKRVQGW